ncbi:hypothetical protein [Streptomyces sp. 5-10]|uniref:hypothetical protein n=1 Tax=Streptomyces sp. 5-10 TaxID=878925 RepID=UPI00168C03DD|nr:hypothetical protein [Streptomyces sp. 5-10]MBD3004623.1 hypothetical protein [Streptomyces sp. 5-10]
MGALEDFPLPSTAQHDEHGNHIPPYIIEWRMAADPTSYAYDPNRVARGREVERNDRQQRRFREHLEEHERRGEPAEVVEEFPASSEE